MMTDRGYIATALAGTLLCTLLAACQSSNSGNGNVENNARGSADLSFTTGDSVSVAENQADTGYTASTDESDANVVSYNLVGGADQNQFNIDTNSGALRFNAAPDFENPTDSDGDNTYIVELQADNGNGDTASQRVTVAVTDVNEAPAFTSSTAVRTAENSTNIGYTTAAKDPEGDTISYSLIDGADQSVFSIDASTGVLSFNAAPDFENPTDADSDNAYLIELQSDDGNGNTATQVATIIVTDIGEFADASVAAGEDPKELAFSWTLEGSAVAFRLEVNPDGASGYRGVDVNGDGAVDTDDELSGIARELELAIALHLTDFVNARYQVVALDDAGTELGRSNELPIAGIMIEALIGYFKASNPDGDEDALGFGDRFGHSVALAGNGDTLAVGASFEDSGATGINGEEDDNSAQLAGAVYIFNRDATGAWSQQAYVKASNTDSRDFFGESVALGDDGNTLAVGAYREDSNATDINGNQSDNSATNTGAVYVFTRDATGAWAQQAYVKASNMDRFDYFGHSVALSGDGDTLAVGAYGDRSSATGINGNQDNSSAAIDAGAVYIFTRDDTGTWAQQVYIKASNTANHDQFGYSVALASDSSTLAVGARGEDSSATGINKNQNDNSATNAGAVYIFTRNAIGAWVQQAYIKASNTDNHDQFGYSVVLAGDGNTLAVGASGEDSNSNGINGEMDDNFASGAGAVYVFTHDDIAGWAQQAYIKASNSSAGDAFGDCIALSGNGDTLAVGARKEQSSATGINGKEDNNSSQFAGAVYVFTRDTTTGWSQQAYVKASNTNGFDTFGHSVALASNGNTLAVGAEAEDSSAAGINGDQGDNNAEQAGAVYLY